jgi:hypothetical protein
MSIFLAILRKVLIFLAPVIINWIWEKKFNQKASPKSIDKDKIMEGKVIK